MPPFRVSALPATLALSVASCAHSAAQPTSPVAKPMPLLRYFSRCGHGGATFKMPNPSLFALPSTGSDAQHQMVEAYPDMVRVMFNHVMPDMQILVGGQPYDDATHTGFSC